MLMFQKRYPMLSGFVSINFWVAMQVVMNIVGYPAKGKEFASDPWAADIDCFDSCFSFFAYKMRRECLQRNQFTIVMLAPRYLNLKLLS